MSNATPTPKSPALWDSRYETDQYIFGTDPNDFLKESASKFSKGSAILSLGEGEGRNAVYLAKLGHSVTTVDLSAVGLQKANRLAQANSVSISTHVADLATYPFGDLKWEGIVSIFCHLPPALRTSVHRKVVQSLKPGGLFLLEAYTPRQHNHNTGGPSDPAMLYDPDDLRQDLHGLEFLVIQERVREIQEGSAHKGTSSVVQIIARKP